VRRTFATAPAADSLASPQKQTDTSQIQATCSSPNSRLRRQSRGAGEASRSSPRAVPSSPMRSSAPRPASDESGRPRRRTRAARSVRLRQPPATLRPRRRGRFATPAAAGSSASCVSSGASRRARFWLTTPSSGPRPSPLMSGASAHPGCSSSALGRCDGAAVQRRATPGEAGAAGCVRLRTRLSREQGLAGRARRFEPGPVVLLAPS